MEKWLALLGNIAPVLRKCGYVALCVFLYWFGGHNVTERQDAVQSAVNTVTSTLTTRLQTVIDGQVGTINDRLKGDTNAINQQYKTGMAGVDRDYHDLLALPAPGLYVNAPTPADCAPAKTGASGSGPAAPRTYRVQLSAESAAALSAEARRADVAAQRLAGAQATIVSWQQAVAAYNAMLDRLYPDVPKVKLK
jgi:hypothetical protein